MATAATIVNVGYRSTNYWVVGTGSSRLLVDLGWPGMVGALDAELKRKGIAPAEISHGLATHYHTDHAGSAQDLKARGMVLIVTAEQVSAIPMMKRHMKETDRYTEIALNDNHVITCAESRSFLARLGFDGEIIHTPGHSDDSVSLVLGTGEAFTGDLTHPDLATDESAETVARSWQRLRDHGATMIYAGHGPVRPLGPR